MKAIRRLGIAGVGLIGGSLAAAARHAGIAREVVGFGRTQENLDVALARGLVDRAGTSPEALAGCDVVVIATPVGIIESTALAIAPHLPDGAVVSDAGSVKEPIVERLTSALAPRLRFVGAHPIAGTEDSGAAAADAELFRGARCVVTALPWTDAEALTVMRELWAAVGMDVVEMSPAAHDAALALTSHVPHVLAFALAVAAAAPVADGSDTLALAGPSFRSATRVAASKPETWRDILLANGPAVLEALGQVRERIGEIEDAIRRGDGAALAAAVARANDARRRLDARGSSGGGGAGAGSPAPGADREAARIEPAAGPLRGSISVPGDKSIAHRALLFGGIARGRTVVRGVGGGEDNASTIRVLQGLGVGVERRGDRVTIEGRGFDGLAAPRGDLECGNSGTTMRLVAGLLAARPFVSRLVGDASLTRRPMRRIIEPLAAMGARIDSDGGRPPLTVHGGRLRPHDFALPIASAQVKTALVLAGLQTDGVTTVAEPALSRDHTERLLPAFGGVLERDGALRLAVRGPQELHAAEIDVPGDPSSAAFWLVAGAIVPGSRVVVRGVGVNPTRTGAIDVLRAMGARIAIAKIASVGEEPVADVTVEAGPLRGTVVAGETMLRAIDEFPVLAVAAACAEGETRFADAAELRVKESDRLAAMARGLARLGVAVEESADGMVVRGPARLCGGEVESHADHRIAMAFAIAALVASAPVVVRGAEAIAVSYPEFLATLEHLRGGTP